MVAIAAATKSQSIWRWLEELQVEDEGSTSWYEEIYSVGFLHLQFIHILARSPTVTVNSAWVLAKHIQDSFSYGYGIRVVQTTLAALFRSTIYWSSGMGF